MSETKWSRRAVLALPAVLPGAASFAYAPESLNISHVAAAHTDDDMLALAAETSIRKRMPLVIDRPLLLTRIWTPPQGLILRGDWSERAVIQCVGPQSGIDIQGPIDIDGITIDGGVDPTADRSIAEYGCLVAIRGALAPTARYLQGVTIGRLRVRRTRRMGIVLANLDGVRIRQMDLREIFSGGLILSGVRNGAIERVDAENIGDLKATGFRYGTAVAIFAATKANAPWCNEKFTLPTDSLKFGQVNISKTTDSAFYIHDSHHTGVTNISIDRLRIQIAGKDGFKYRAGPKGLRVGSIEVDRAALRGVDIESDDVRIQHIKISECGFDAIGEILGRAAVFTGKDAVSESIQTHPNGIVIMDCRDVELPDFSISEVAANPAKGTEGNGLHMAGATNVKVKGTIAHCDGSGVRISGSSDFDLDVAIFDVCRKPPNNKPILFSSDGRGMSKRGRLRGSVAQAVGGPAAQIVDAKAACEVDVELKYDVSQFPRHNIVRGNPGRSCDVAANSNSSSAPLAAPVPKRS